MSKNHRWPVALFAAAALCIAAGDAIAQGKGGQGKGAQQPARPQVDEALSQQPNKPQMNAPQRQKQAAAEQRLRRELTDDEIYGHEMMTAEERERYREKLNAAASDKEWAQLRAEHQEAMQARAEAQSRALEAPVYGQHMMTAEEQKRFIERMQAAASEAEREEVREQHRDTINARAKEFGIDPENPRR